nr:response regulator transcription factor [Bowdeniella massiliensis]
MLKDALPAELVAAVRSAARGESVLAPAATAHLIGHVSRPESGVLTNRELEVLQLVADGASNKEAAAALFIGQASVKTHLQHIFHKLGVNDRAAAVAEGYRRRLLS